MYISLLLWFTLNYITTMYMYICTRTYTVCAYFTHFFKELDELKYELDAERAKKFKVKVGNNYYNDLRIKCCMLHINTYVCNREMSTYVSLVSIKWYFVVNKFVMMHVCVHTYNCTRFSMHRMTWMI